MLPPRCSILVCLKHVMRLHRNVSKSSVLNGLQLVFDKFVVLSFRFQHRPCTADSNASEMPLRIDKHLAPPLVH